jgi:DNA-directed RNA polymerase specialized sigma24 family protein
MRWVLVEYARKRKRKRQLSVSLDDVSDETGMVESESDELLLELHEALEQLAILDPIASKACDLHYFGGHSTQEITNILHVSSATIDRKMRFAKAWMRSEFDGLRKALPTS